jgi:hypothetical protein
MHEGHASAGVALVIFSNPLRPVEPVHDDPAGA